MGCRESFQSLECWFVGFRVGRGGVMGCFFFCQRKLYGIVGGFTCLGLQSEVFLVWVIGFRFGCVVFEGVLRVYYKRVCFIEEFVLCGGIMLQYKIYWRSMFKLNWLIEILMVFLCYYKLFQGSLGVFIMQGSL